MSSRCNFGSMVKSFLPLNLVFHGGTCPRAYAASASGRTKKTFMSVIVARCVVGRPFTLWLV